MNNDLLFKLTDTFSDKSIILLFDSCYSTVKLYNDIRLTCYKVLRINNVTDIQMLKLDQNDVIITDVNTYDQIKEKYNINCFVIQSSTENITYNTFLYNCIKLTYIESDRNSSFEKKNLTLLSTPNKQNNTLFNAWNNSTLQTAVATTDYSQISESLAPLHPVPTVYIVIPTYNQDKFTNLCFESINRCYDFNYDIHIVWVDNGSSKTSIKNVKAANRKLMNLKGKIHCINFDTPIGYVKSTNSGIEYALSKKADYIILQNNDTIVTDGWLEPLIKVLKENDDVVGSGPITNSSLARQGFDKIKINVLKDLPDFSNSSTEEITNTLHNMYKDFSIVFEDENSVDVTLAFYCAAFKRSIFEEIGLLDESFGFGYGDDVDFCQRVFLAHKKLAFVPESYVLHNHRTTFKSIYTDQQIKDIIKARVLQCKIRNKFNTDKRKKIAVYTCIVGGYDRLLPLENVDIYHCDYFCFSDTPIKNHDPYWTIININPFKKYIEDMDCCETPEELNTKLARYIKVNPHLFFPNYETSVWIDGNVNILSSVYEYAKTIPENQFIFIPQHPLRNCVYEEIEACRKLKKDTDEHLDNVKSFLLKEKYPKNNGMVQSGVMIRKHNDKRCIESMNNWWNMIQQYSKRDQLSFNYTFWKLGYQYFSLPWNDILNKFIKLLFKHSKK